MLVNMNEVLAAVQARGCCVGAFDTPNLEILMAVIRAAENGRSRSSSSTPSFMSRRWRFA